MSDPTPTPWYIGAQNDCLYIINQPPRPSSDDVNPDREVEVVAKVYVPMFTESTEAANANHIVRAVNAYDPLVAACRKALDYLADMAYLLERLPEDDRFYALRDDLRNALAERTTP